MLPELVTDKAEALRHGLVIPAHPLALTAERKLDERRQRALTRYYLAAGAGGVAVAVHTTQFAIREPGVGLLRPVLELAADVVDRAVADSGRSEHVALYTGNDDHIVLDLLTPFRLGERTLRIVGGLLGQWAVWTRRAVELLAQVQRMGRDERPISAELLVYANELTDANAAFFDPVHQFSGSIAGIHEVLRRQGLLGGRWCLDPEED